MLVEQHEVTAGIISRTAVAPAVGTVILEAIGVHVDISGIVAFESDAPEEGAHVRLVGIIAPDGAGEGAHEEGEAFRGVAAIGITVGCGHAEFFLEQAGDILGTATDVGGEHTAGAIGVRLAGGRGVGKRGAADGAAIGETSAVAAGEFLDALEHIVEFPGIHDDGRVGGDGQAGSDGAGGTAIPRIAIPRVERVTANEVGEDDVLGVVDRLLEAGQDTGVLGAQIVFRQEHEAHAPRIGPAIGV